MNQILCPVDFSKTALNALEYAVSIAEMHGAELSLVYVFTEAHYNKELPKGVKSYSEYEDEFKSKLQVICNEIKSENFKANSYVLSGNFLNAIQEFVKTKKIDMIVTGTKGVSDVFDKMAGSNTIKLLDNVDLPILAVPKKASFNGLKKIVYATSYKKEDKVAISNLVSFSEPCNSEITVLHLSKRDNIIGETLWTNFKEELAEFVRCDSIKFERRFYSDSIVSEIDKYMLEEQVDVLALLMEKRNLIDRLFHKSVTKDLTYLMDFPMLVYKNSSSETQKKVS